LTAPRADQLADQPILVALPAARPGWLRRRSTWTLAIKALTYVLATVFGLLFLGPFLFAVSGSLMRPAELYVIPPRWLPSTPVWGNYLTVWTMVPFALYIRNTLIVTSLAMLGQLASCSLVAYGFARFRFPGRSVIFILLLGTMAVPGEVTTIPQFLLFKGLGWTNSFLPLIVPSYFGGGAFSVFLLRQFFLTLPRDLDDAATIDGAGSLRILVQLLLPLSKPALATVAILSFVYHWNDFFTPLIYLDSKQLYTVALGLSDFKSEPTGAGPPMAHLLMGASIIVTIPIIVVFFSLQRYFVQGIVMSGIKG
jgi:ABC-type glycerol-3-phosphate transport system permease component